MVVDPTVRSFTKNVIGAKVEHIAVFNDDILDNGISIIMKKGKTEYALNITLPNDTHLSDCVEMREIEE